MKKSGFTLIELLVIISIVAVLAGLALPLTLWIREKAVASDCLRHLHNLGTGCSAYLADHNNQAFSSETPGGWPAVLHAKYIPDWAAFRSPFDKRPDGVISPSGAGVQISYGINIHTLNQSKDGFDGNFAKLTSPAQLIYMAPNVDLTQTTLTFFPLEGNLNVALNPPKTQPVTNGDFRGTHAGRAQINALFADFHAASISYKDYATTSSPDGSGQARWQPIHR